MNRHRADVPVEPLRVAIVAAYSADLPSSNNRFNDLARRLSARGADVELITSDFSHGRKERRSWDFGPTPYRITRLHEPGYRRNISLARLRSQAVLAQEVGRYLDALELPPQLVLAAVPPPRVALACARHVQRTGAVLAVDVQDVWPEAFTMVAPVPAAVDLLFTRMRRASRTAYTTADRVVGVSRTFTDLAVGHGADPERVRVVPLGTDLARFDAHAAAPEPTVIGGTPVLQGPVIGYVGSLNASYDVPLVIDALELLARDPQSPPVPPLVIMGDGELRARFEEHARRSALDVRFTGNLPYADMVRTLSRCGIAVNPLVAGSGGSILNKACDYAAAGLPVVSSQESPEYRELLERYGAGISCEPGDAPQMALALRRLLEDPGLRARMGAASRRMAEELFDRSVTYEQMIDELLELTARRRAGGRPAVR